MVEGELMVADKDLNLREAGLIIQTLTRPDSCCGPSNRNMGQLCHGETCLCWLEILPLRAWVDLY